MPPYFKNKDDSDDVELSPKGTKRMKVEEKEKVMSDLMRPLNCEGQPMPSLNSLSLNKDED